MIAEWIRFADAKAAVVLTAGAAVTGFIVPTLQGYLDAAHSLPMRTIVLALFGGWLATVVLSAVRAFCCILPIRQKGRHPARDACCHFHPAGISHHYRIEEFDRFLADYQQLGSAGFRQQIIASVLIDAHVSSRKYGHVTAAIKLFGLSALFAFFYLLVIQF
jgi:hypothetical protein